MFNNDSGPRLFEGKDTNELYYEIKRMIDGGLLYPSGIFYIKVSFPEINGKTKVNVELNGTFSLISPIGDLLPVCNILTETGFSFSEDKLLNHRSLCPIHYSKR
jgi:hypothetical protein